MARAYDLITRMLHTPICFAVLRVEHGDRTPGALCALMRTQGRRFQPSLRASAACRVFPGSSFACRALASAAEIRSPGLQSAPQGASPCRGRHRRTAANVDHLGRVPHPGRAHRRTKGRPQSRRPRLCACAPRARRGYRRQCRRSDLSRAGEAECDHERHPTPRVGSWGSAAAGRKSPHTTPRQLATLNAPSGTRPPGARLSYTRHSPESLSPIASFLRFDRDQWDRPSGNA
jgi:hypothetical protein